MPATPMTDVIPAVFIAELVAAWNSHDLDRTAALYAPDYFGEDISEPRPQQGRQAMIEGMARLLQAFPDLQVAMDEFVVEGNRIVLFWTMQGTHRGRMMKIPATGRPVAVRGVSLLEVHDGLIVRSVRLWDVAGLLRKLRLLPDLE